MKSGAKHSEFEAVVFGMIEIKSNAERLIYV